MLSRKQYALLTVLCTSYFAHCQYATLAKCPTNCVCNYDSLSVSCSADGQSLIANSSELNSSIVERLDYRQFLVCRLEKEHISSLNHLRELSIVRCSVTDIANAAFVNNAYLERIDLSQNLLTALNQNMFTGLVRLKSLDLSSNKLSRIDAAFSQLLALKHLNLCDNELTVIDAHSLQSLNIESNNISTIHEGAFERLSNLTNLIISHNPLRNLLHLDLFANRLISVDISSSHLNRVPSVVARYVQELRIPGNNLATLNRGDFESFSHIQLLVLDDNRIISIEEDTLGRLDKLRQLFLSGNLLSDIPDSLPCSSLTELYMQRNQFTSIKLEDFNCLAHLQRLDLSRNSISHVAMAAFGQMTSLLWLDLSHNRLSYVTQDMFYGLANLHTLDISANGMLRVEPMTFLHLPSVQILAHETQMMETSLMDSNSEPPILIRKITAATTQKPINNVKSTTTSHVMNVIETTRKMTNSPDAYQPQDRIKNETKTSNVTKMGNDAAIQKDSKKSSKPARDHDQTTEVWSSFLFWWMVTTTAIFVGLLCALACICCTTRSRWLQVKLAFWKRHSISTPLQKDAIKLAWAIDDFDQWSTSLTPRQDTEHERLLLAVNPNY